MVHPNIEPRLHARITETAPNIRICQEIGTEMVERKIDFSYLVFCWQDDSPDNAYYLDRKTGDVRLVNQHLLDLRQLTDEIEKDRERYLYVPKPDKTDMLSDLHDFQHEVSSEQLKRLLSVAFESPHVLLAFKKILQDDQEQSQHLREFLEERVAKRIETWLNANSVARVWAVDEEDLEDPDENEDYDDEIDDKDSARLNFGV